MTVNVTRNHARIRVLAVASVLCGVAAVSSACVSPTELAKQVKGDGTTTSASAEARSAEGTSAEAAADSSTTRSSSSTTRSSSSRTSVSAEPENTGVMELNVGDCVKDDMSGSGTVYDAGKVDCSSPHRSELYYREDLPSGPYPGTSEVTSQAKEICKREFEPFIGKDYDSSELDVIPLYPLSSGWSRGDHAVDCYVVDPHGDVTGSLRDSRR